MKEYLEKQMSTILGIIRVNGDIGIELEVEGENLPTSVPGWHVKHEGSLRGKGGRAVAQGESLSDTPREYVSRGAVPLDGVTKHLKDIHDRLTYGNSTPILTPRASTHIHLNMSQETLQTFLIFHVIFAMAEPVLLRMCGPQRNGNLFCLPAYESADLPGYVSRVYKTINAYGSKRRGGDEYIRQYWPKRGKYAALNSDPIISFGSVECRCFPNSIDPAEIEEWVRFMARCREIARSLDVKTVVEFLDRAYNEPMWFLSQLFSLDGIFSQCAPNHPSELVMYGVEQAYEIIRPLQRFPDEEEKKPKKRSGITVSYDDLVTDDTPTWAIPAPADVDDMFPEEE